MSHPRPTTDPAPTSALVSALEARLDDGYRRIGIAAATGVDVDAWEAFWVELLDQYVAACDVMDVIAEVERGPASGHGDADQSADPDRLAA